MAKKTVTIVVCDKCGRDTPDATRWIIKGPDTHTTIDLCKQDARPLQELAGTGRPKTRRRKTVEVFEDESQIERVTT